LKLPELPSPNKRIHAQGRKNTLRRIQAWNLDRLKDSLKDERGSAVIEFVVLTVPLFLPFALYLTVVHSSTQIAFDAHSLARQAARAYVTSPSADFVDARVQMVATLFTDQVLAKHGITSKPEITFTCEADPCLTPGAKVQATVTIADKSQAPSGYLRFIGSSNSQVVVAKASQVVDLWRSS
jgi:hypothetical protein